MRLAERNLMLPLFLRFEVCCDRQHQFLGGEIATFRKILRGGETQVCLKRCVSSWRIRFTQEPLTQHASPFRQRTYKVEAYNGKIGDFENLKSLYLRKYQSDLSQTTSKRCVSARSSFQVYINFSIGAILQELAGFKGIVNFDKVIPGLKLQTTLATSILNRLT